MDKQIPICIQIISKMHVCLRQKKCLLLENKHKCTSENYELERVRMKISYLLYRIKTVYETVVFLKYMQTQTVNGMLTQNCKISGTESKTNFFNVTEHKLLMVC